MGKGSSLEEDTWILDKDSILEDSRRSHMDWILGTHQGLETHPNFLPWVLLPWCRKNSEFVSGSMRGKFANLGKSRFCLSWNLSHTKGWRTSGTPSSFRRLPRTFDEALSPNFAEGWTAKGRLTGEFFCSDLFSPSQCSPPRIPSACSYATAPPDFRTDLARDVYQDTLLCWDLQWSFFFEWTLFQAPKLAQRRT